MKILQINTVCGSGSTGSIATDIAATAEQRGHTCHIAYGQGTTTYPNSFKIGGRIENHLHNIGSRVRGNQGYYSRCGTRKLIGYIDVLKPDLIHLHNLHGNYLHLPTLFEYLCAADIPVVLTLHDCWAFTGKCSHYTAVGCSKWKTRCGKCPQYKSYPPSLLFDRSAGMYAQKKEWFTSLKKLHVVTVSKWLEKEVSQSFLSSRPISQIYNWVDHRIFRRIDPGQTSIYEKYGLPREFNYLVSVSAGWDKNSLKYRDAVALSRALPADYRLLLVGRTARGTQIQAPIYHIPYTSDQRELAAIYSLAMAYVHLSVEDTFGKVIAEAMACGTQPIVFDSTACSEVTGQLGYTVAPHNTAAIARLLAQAAPTPGKCEALASFVRKQYDIDRNTGQYVDLYEQLVSK